MIEGDPFNLGRFLEAQQTSYETALSEIRRGAKRTHWMWYIFPQLVGLGLSALAQRFAIRSLDEARSYLDHPVLGGRYVECVTALQELTETTAEKVFGPVDALKLRSSLTLFAEASGRPLLQAALARWFASSDQVTLQILGTPELAPRSPTCALSSPDVSPPLCPIPPRKVAAGIKLRARRPPN